MNDCEIGSSWLSPLRKVLDASDTPITWHFRDDDAGWADESLWRMLDLFERHEQALDLAVIPAALQPAAASELRARGRAMALGLHQHGYAHANHEPSGRKCEFGPSRARAQQRADLSAGRERLRALLGECDPIFTPPWNRCTQDTVDCMAELGLRGLSRDDSAGRLQLNGVIELAVNLDWQRHARDPQALGNALASVARGGRAAIMLHHAPMAADHWLALNELLDLVARSANCRTVLMRALLTNEMAEVKCAG